MIVAPSLLKNDEVLNSYCHELKEERLSLQQGKALLHATERPLQIEKGVSSPALFCSFRNSGTLNKFVQSVSSILKMYFLTGFC
jgi:hypothetical protein